MKNITSHHDGHGLNESIIITATDVHGGAHHHYEGVVHAPDKWATPVPCLTVQFQKPRDEADYTPGMTTVALLAVVESQLEDFQSGPFASREGALALTKVQEAMHWLRHHADDHARRGVLGRNER